MNAEAYLGLGAHLGNPKDTFEKALGLVANFAKIKKVSRLYKSAPFGFSDQPPFINAAVRINTDLPDIDLSPGTEVMPLMLVEGFTVYFSDIYYYFLGVALFKKETISS